MFQRGVELSHPRPVIVEDQIDVLSLASGDLIREIGGYCYTKLRQVKTSKGNIQEIRLAGTKLLAIKCQ